MSGYRVFTWGDDGSDRLFEDVGNYAGLDLVAVKDRVYAKSKEDGKFRVIAELVATTKIVTHVLIQNYPRPDLQQPATVQGPLRQESEYISRPGQNVWVGSQNNQDGPPPQTQTFGTPPENTR